MSEPAFPAGDMAGMEPSSGMALRDWFAGQALIACADHDYGNDWGKSGVEWAPKVASRAYRLADAMLKARGSNHDHQDR